MAEDKMMFYIVALVAVVAVFGMVFMTLSVTQNAAKVSAATGDSAGAAYSGTQIPVVVTPDMTYRECVGYYHAEGCARLCAYGKIDCGQYT